MTAQKKLELNDLISQGKIHKAIKLLLSIEMEAKNQEKVYAISARFNLLQEKKLSGTLSVENISLLENQIVQQTLSLIEELTTNKPAELNKLTNMSNETKPKINWPAIIIALITTIGTIIVAVIQYGLTQQQQPPIDYVFKGVLIKDGIGTEPLGKTRVGIQGGKTGESTKDGSFTFHLDEDDLNNLGHSLKFYIPNPNKPAGQPLFSEEYQIETYKEKETKNIHIYNFGNVLFPTLTDREKEDVGNNPSPPPPSIDYVFKGVLIKGNNIGTEPLGETRVGIQGGKTGESTKDGSFTFHLDKDDLDNLGHSLKFYIPNPNKPAGSPLFSEEYQIERYKEKETKNIHIYNFGNVSFPTHVEEKKKKAHILLNMKKIKFQEGYSVLDEEGQSIFKLERDENNKLVLVASHSQINNFGIETLYLYSNGKRIGYYVLEIHHSPRNYPSNMLFKND